ncbi:MAG TPA: UPF0175 family protein [Phycisphaerae bacterium]|jgi:predicted HTH domain antitoxin|nr:UPF0175 family protein [Phycisphaerae bacterium]
MQLTLTLNLPPDLEARVRANIGDPQADAAEAYAVDLYRRGVLSHYELSQLLKLDRFETDGVLKRHDVMIEMTPQRFQEELADLRKIAAS